MAVRNSKQITSLELRSLMSYNPESGVATWLPRAPHMFKTDKAHIQWNAKCAGKTIGSKNKNLYTRVNIFGRKYLLHRVIWLYHYGELPKGIIDHKNGIKSDNRLKNLRDVDHVENSKNMPIPSHNTSGHMGVHWDTRKCRWIAKIKIGDRTVSKHFVDKLEAANYRKLMMEKYGFSENHGRLKQESL